MLKATERYPAPKCHPDTRREAQAVVRNWICKGEVSHDGKVGGEEDGEDGWVGGVEGEEGAANGAIMWLSGAPGVGKSAILQTVCEELAGGDSPSDACHFFGRGQGKREKAFYFPATIAYKLGLSSTVHRSVIRGRIKKDPAVLLESVDAQFRKLVVDTVAIAEGELLCWKPTTVVIDALDEADDTRDQVALLELLFSAATNNGMRFLIASRPEQAIHTFFHHPDVRPHVHHVRLDEATFQTSRDIYVFLVKSFDRIRQSRPGSFPVLPGGELWPGTAVLRLLTADSDAQFIFPHLIIESIDADPLTSPHEQLQSILTYTATDTFSKLDALYQQILSRCLQGPPSRRDRNKSLLMGVLRVIICWQEELSIAGIADVLDEETYMVENIIRGPMRCLFVFEDEDSDSIVDLSHKSLRDCVLSRNRAGEFFISSDRPDDLFAEILSRPPPADPKCTFPPHALVGVIQCIIGLTYFRKLGPNPDDIASILDLGPDAVRNVLRGPQRSLFLYEEGGEFKLSQHVFRPFLDKVEQYRDSWRTPLDAFFARMLSLPPPSDPRKSFSRQDLMDVLRAITTCPSITLFEIASLTGMHLGTVENVVRGPQAYLFRWDGDGYGQAVELDEGIPLYATDLYDFLHDDDRSREFHISQNDVDTLLVTFLSRALPRDSPTHGNSLSYEDLKRVIHAVFAFGGRPTIPDIASILSLELGVVCNIVYGAKGCFFGVEEEYGQVSIIPHADGSFFTEATRSGRFHLSATDLASLFLPILSCPPPTDPEKSFSRDDLMGVLLTILLFGGTDITIPDIATLLGVKPNVVRNVICGPQHLLFDQKIGWGTSRVMFMRPFPQFWLNAELSGEFCIRASKIDALLISILSHPLPTGAQQAYCPWGLLAIFGAVLTFASLTIADLASVVGIEPDFARDLVKGPQQLLFHTRGDTVGLSLSEPTHSFFHNRDRSGEFYISRHDSDAFLIRYLSRPPPVDPEHSYTRQCLMDAIRFLFVSNASEADIMVVVLASKLNINPRVAHNVVSGPHNALFATYYTKDTTNPDPESVRFWISRRPPVLGIKNFLLDPLRAGEFYLGP